MMKQNESSTLLRRALRANGAFSAVSGLILILAAGPLATLLGLAESSILIGVGVSLLVYAVGLFRNARRETINRVEATIAVVLDVAWVAGSAVVIFAGVLTTTGNWVVAIVADVVLLFGVLQFYGLRRLRREKLGSA
jgi:hypothetical protein